MTTQRRRRDWRRAGLALCAIVALLTPSFARARGEQVVCFTSWRLGSSGAFFGPLDDLRSTRAVPDQARWTINPVISPDESRIVYSTEMAIYIHDIATGETERATEPGDFVSHPEWSPDGGRLAFWSTGVADDDAGFYVRDLDTGDTALVARSRHMARPSWSPHGDEIAHEEDGRIFIVDVESGDRRLAIQRDGAKHIHPSWSPDGERFAFVSDRDGPADVYVAGLDGENARQLTEMGGVHWPRWTPDGLSVIFSASGGGGSDIYIVDIEGGPPRQLTDNPRNDYPSLADPAVLPVTRLGTLLTQWASMRGTQ